MEMKINIFQEWLICLTLRPRAEIHGIQNRGIDLQTMLLASCILQLFFNWLHLKNSREIYLFDKAFLNIAARLKCYRQ